VTLYGSRLPKNPSVLVDGVPARVIVANAPRTVTVEMPRHVPGKADITVFAPDNTYDTLRAVYTYVPSPNGPTGPGPGTNPGPTAAPTTAPTTAPTAAPQPSGPGSTPTAEPSPGNEQPLPDGVALVPVRAGGMLAGASVHDWSLATCATSRCDSVGL
jgi:hypothetical protein